MVLHGRSLELHIPRGPPQTCQCARPTLSLTGRMYTFAQMAQKTCLFCADSADSNEHFWPKWMLPLIDRSNPLRITRAEGKSRSFSGDFQIGCVCSTCNQNWMSRLEGEVTPIMTPMLSGSGVELSQAQQIVLSEWVTKTAMVFEGVRPRAARHFFSDSCRRAFRAQRIIPALTKIQIGRFVPGGLFCTGFDFSLPIGEFDAGIGFVITFVAGQFVAQIISLQPDPPNQGQDCQLTIKSGNWSKMLVDVWPVSQKVLWPPCDPFISAEGPFSIRYLSERHGPL
jgi:hypothetical protein